MKVWHLVFKVDSLTYTVAKALSHGGHEVFVWVVAQGHDYGLSEGIYRCLRDTPRVTIVGNDEGRLPPAMDRLIVQVFPRPLDSVRDVPLLARRARAITLISAGDRSRSWRSAVKLQWVEARAFGRQMSKVDRVLYKDGFHSHDLHGLLKSRRALGFDVHSQFLHDEELFRVMHARDWDPHSRRPFHANFLGSRDPEVRKRILDTVRSSLPPGNGRPPPTPTGKSSYWHEYTDAAAIGLEPKEFVRILSESDFTLCPRGYSLVTHRPIEALLRGSIPVLSTAELDLYGIELADRENCIGVPDGRWLDAIRQLARTDEADLVRMRGRIHAMFDGLLDYRAVAKRLRTNLGLED